MIEKLKEYSFLFEELVKRDFKQKYKGTSLGMLWSIMYPLLNLLVLVLVFKKLLGRNTPHYTIYIFCGTLVMSFFRESTRGGMNSLVSNSNVITKINIPKYLFLLSKNVSCFINFALTLLVFFVICIFDKISFNINFFMLIIPICCLTIFNIGVGLILSALFVFFRDMNYLYDILLTIINYLSAIFYSVDSFSPTAQRLFLLNPMYCYIKYFRLIVINGSIPSLQFNLLCILYAVVALVSGLVIYKKNNTKFLYYM